jgi:hypothetical protein
MISTRLFFKSIILPSHFLSLDHTSEIGAGKIKKDPCTCVQQQRKSLKTKNQEKKNDP